MPRWRSADRGQRWHAVLIALAVVVSLVHPSFVPAAQAAPGGDSKIEFGFISLKTNPVCVGDKEEVLVWLRRKLLQSDPRYDGYHLGGTWQPVPGIAIDASVIDPSIGSISPARLITDVHGYARFSFRAMKPGETTIDFEATVVTPGWFGTAIGGDSQSGVIHHPIEVRACAFKVETTSQFSAQGVKLVANMSGEIKSDGQGNLTGVGAVQWTGGVTKGFNNCSGTIEIGGSQADLTGKFDEQGQLVTAVTYTPAALTHAIQCGSSQTVHADVVPNPLAATLSSSGGVLTQPQDLFEPSYYSMHGTSVTVVVPVDGGSAP